MPPRAAPSETGPTRSRRIARLWDLRRTRLIICGGVALGLLTGLAIWHGGSSGHAGGVGRFLFDVVFLGLVVFSPLAMLALALADWAAGFLGALFVIAFGSLGLRVSTRRNGKAARSGDARAQAKIDHWKRWQREWTR